MGLGRGIFTNENNQEKNGKINGIGKTKIHACPFGNIRAFTIPSENHSLVALALLSCNKLQKGVWMPSSQRKDFQSFFCLAFLWPLRKEFCWSYPEPNRDSFGQGEKKKKLPASLWTQYKCYCGPRRLIHYNKAIKFRDCLKDKKQSVITSSEKFMMDFCNFLQVHGVAFGDLRQDGVTAQWGGGRD